MQSRQKDDIFWPYCAPQLEIFKSRAAAHVSDVTELYVLALEKGELVRYDASVEEGVTARAIAEAIGTEPGCPYARSQPTRSGAISAGWHR